jgi:hypothetical protein
VLGVRGLVRALRRLNLASLSHKRTLRLAATWPAAGRLTLVLQAHGIQIARGTRLIGHGGRASLTLKLSARGGRLLARSKRLRIALSESFRPAAGGPTASAHTAFLLRH